MRNRLDIELFNTKTNEYDVFGYREGDELDLANPQPYLGANNEVQVRLKFDEGESAQPAFGKSASSRPAHTAARTIEKASPSLKAATAAVTEDTLQQTIERATEQTIIRTQALKKSFGEFEALARYLAGSAGRFYLWIRRSQWRRKDHHHAHPDHAHPPQRRTGVGRGSLGVGRSSRRAARHRLHARRIRGL